MVPVLLYVLLKKLFRKKRHIATKLFYKKTLAIISFVILLLLTSCLLFSQQQSLSYKVIRNGDETGWVKLNRNINGHTSIINMASEIKVRMIFLFTIISNEYVECRDDKLVHAYVFRKMNGSIKADAHTRLAGNTYETEDYSGKEKLNIIPSSFTVLDMYFKQPDGITKVYSGSQQQNLPVIKKQPSMFIINMPDGNTNEYYYNKEGICSRVKINQSLYTVEFILTQP
jgi:hypothetical protein